MKVYDATKLSYVKLHEAVRVNGAMVQEVHDATASALGVVVPSTGGAVLIPWHAVRWAVQAEPEVRAYYAGQVTNADRHPAAKRVGLDALADVPKRKRGKASE